MFVLTESVEGETASRQSQLPTFSHIFRVKQYLQYLKTVVPKVGAWSSCQQTSKICATVGKQRLFFSLFNKTVLLFHWTFDLRGSTIVLSTKGGRC